MVIEARQVTGLLLAGGRGSRMGGVDKGLQLHRGRALAFDDEPAFFDVNTRDDLDALDRPSLG